MAKELIDNDGNLINCCINCRHFALWEEDWCCTWHMKIIQHGEKFENNAVERIQTASVCSDYEISNMPWIEDYERQFKIDLGYGTF